MRSKVDSHHYIVAGNKPWNRSIFNEVIMNFPGEWRFAGSPEELTVESLRSYDPRYVFFLHWSWKVPREIVDGFECVCFHMTDLPYGRGGSPLQNLILRRHQHTQLTALKMTEEFDGGPIYFKENLCLSGIAEEVYIRATRLAFDMIRRIIADEPSPTPQIGEATVFRRRKPEESEIAEVVGMEALYDFMRMLDAETYPRAFLIHKGFKYEFSRPALYEGRIVADVTIKPESVKFR